MKPTFLSQPQKRISWFARATGATKEILGNCSTGCINAFSYAGMTIIFTALMSAGVLSFAVSSYCFDSDNRIFALIFVLWTIFIYLFDRMVVLGNSPITKWVRIAAIFVLALFHSFILDTMALRKDINARLKVEYGKKVSAINREYDSLAKPLQAKIEIVQIKNDSINKKKQSYIDSLQAEATGFGGSHHRGISTIYKNLVLLKEENSKQADSNLKANNIVIAKYENSIGTINTERENIIASTVKPENLGLMERVRIMHKIVFVQGSALDIIFYMIWLGIFCFIECLPVLGKEVFKKRMQEYYKGEDADQENSEMAMKTKKLHDWTVMESEMALDLQLRLAKISSDSFIKNIELEKQHIHLRLLNLEDFLRELDDIEASLKSAFPHKYSEFIKPEINRARSSFTKTMDRNA